MESRNYLYRAGAQLPSVRDFLQQVPSNGTSNLLRDFDHLQRLLSALSVETVATTIFTTTEDARLLGGLVLSLLCRGWPTMASPNVERSLVEAIPASTGLSSHVYEEHRPEIGFKLKSPNGDEETWGHHFLNALSRPDERLRPNDRLIGALADHPNELEFYYSFLVSKFGAKIGWLVPQRPLRTMVADDVRYDKPNEQERVDFALEVSRPNGDITRVVIELDGSQHASPGQSAKDRAREARLTSSGWTVLRTPSGRQPSVQFARSIEAVASALSLPFTDEQSQIGSSVSDQMTTAFSLVLAPHAIARIQVALCRALIDGALPLRSESWRVGVIERDVPCAELAVRDWLGTLSRFAQLYGLDDLLPERIDLHIIPVWLSDRSVSPADFMATPNATPEIRTTTGVRTIERQRLHLMIDCSVTAQTTRDFLPISGANEVSQGEYRVLVRTAPYVDQIAPSFPDRLSHVPEVFANEKLLEYFLQLVFRKKSFRDRQVPIIQRALRGKDVIGLLPTGSGKSIAFQLPAMLMPGLTLVVDPLKSLMQDQVSNLNDVGILDCCYINSDLGARERKQIQSEIASGHYRMVFISPERFQSQEFRDMLRGIFDMRPLSLLVVDEAHCVSEWGHDFRIAYLNLGRLATEQFGTRGRRPFVALTGTASEAVLQDIQRELKITEDDAIVRPDSFHRKELQFEIVRVLAGSKRSELARQVLDEIPMRLGLDSTKEFGGIVFCPHINGKQGVADVSEFLKQELELRRGTTSNPLAGSKVAYYSGDKPNSVEMNQSQWAEYKRQAQKSFKSGETTILVATSAFGMGIDKPDIRFTVHLAMTKSAEAFAQEAGRAGRDRAVSVCAVLFTDSIPSEGNDILEEGISIETAKDRMDAATQKKQERDDAATQFYLHSTSYLGAEVERTAILGICSRYLVPGPSEVRRGERQFWEVSLQQEDVDLAMIGPEDAGIDNTPATLRGHAPGRNAEDKKKAVPGIERIIYRLTLLGMIRDYTIDYSAGNRVFRLRVEQRSDEEIVANLFDYIGRYATVDRRTKAQSHFESAPYSDVLSKSVDTLCWFVYEEIESRRRQAMFNMRQLLRESRDGMDFGNRLDKMLSTTALTQEVFSILSEEGLDSWQRVGREISPQTAERVYYQCRRALEDAPSHPGLEILMGLALLSLADGREAEVTKYLVSGGRTAATYMADAEFAEMVLWEFDQVQSFGERVADAVIAGVVSNCHHPAVVDAAIRFLSGRRSADRVETMRALEHHFLDRMQISVGRLLDS